MSHVLAKNLFQSLKLLCECNSSEALESSRIKANILTGLLKNSTGKERQDEINLVRIQTSEAELGAIKPKKYPNLRVMITSSLHIRPVAKGV